MSVKERERLGDLPYVRSFVPELSPEWLDLVAATNGVASPGARAGFRWCELGCGLGLTSVVCAGLHPASHFTAIDSRPDHTAAAEGLRRAARADNLSVHTKRFEDTGDVGIPPQDYIVAHGVYSWIDDASREALHAFVARYLAPGGLLYLSYNALPGWAADATFQHLIRSLAEDAPGGTLERFSRSAETVQHLIGSGGDGGALGRTVAGRDWSSYISRHDPAYLPHEYLVPGWRAFYVDEVQQAMGQLGLTLAGSATFEENFNAILITQTQREVLAAIVEPSRRELARDFLIDQRFRRDVYARAPRPLDRDEQRHTLLHQQFVLLRPGARTELSIATPRGQVSCDTPTTRRLVDALVNGPKRLTDCVAGADPDALIAGMLMLCCAGVVWPAVEAPTDVSALNAALERIAHSEDALYRVAPQATAVLQARLPSPEA